MNEELKQDLCLLLLSLILLLITLPMVLPPVEALRLKQEHKQNNPQTKGWTVIESKEEWLWTPLMFVHSPRYGYTKGETEWKWKIKYTIGPYETTSETTYKHGLVQKDGKCAGVFQLCKWRYEKLHLSGWYTYSPTEEKWYAVEWGGKYWKRLDGNSRNTCEDDITSFEYIGYKSFEFNIRYKEHNDDITVDPGIDDA